MPSVSNFDKVNAGLKKQILQLSGSSILAGSGPYRGGLNGGSGLKDPKGGDATDRSRQARFSDWDEE